MVLTAGSIVGVICGLAHALYVYRVTTPSSAGDSPPGGVPPIYYALWTLALWVLFGTYVLVLWAVGLLVYIVFKAFR